MIGIADIFMFTCASAYSVIEGWREAYYFAEKYDLSVLIKHDEHALFMAQRGIVLLMTGFALGSWEMAFGLLLMFPFFHDGMYYTVRHNIDERLYPNTWFDHTDSSALINFNPVSRVWLFVIGNLLYWTHAFFNG